MPLFSHNWFNFKSCVSAGVMVFLGYHSKYARGKDYLLLGQLHGDFPLKFVVYNILIYFIILMWASIPKCLNI